MRQARQWSRAGIVALGLSLPLHASAQTVDLASLGARGFPIGGLVAPAGTGGSVAIAGDLNGDGRADVVIGSAQGGVSFSGRVDVVFGRAGNAPVDLDALGTGGFTLYGAAPGDRAGSRVAAAGDVNGDGIDDLLIAAPDADPGGLDAAGIVYVVFGGSASLAERQLDSLGSGGFAISGTAAGQRIGTAIAAAGDVNGDGIDDILIGAAAADVGYVIFGSSSSSDLALATLGARGITIGTQAIGSELGRAVAGIGDVNDDRIADLAISAPLAAPDGGRTGAGTSYVVFGRIGLGNVEVETLGAGGYAIHGAWAGDQSGAALAAVGDVNGDGVPDLAIGVPGFDPASDRFDAGQVCVVFGKADTDMVELAALDADGFCINGAAEADQVGSSIAAAGDVNGDGHADLVIGAREADGRSGAGYVVYGSADPATIELGALSTDGFAITAAANLAGTGLAVGGGGDVDGDGFADIVIGSPFVDPASLGASGAAHVVFGQRNFTSVESPPDLDAGDRFGTSIAADGSRFAVGIPGGGSSGAGQVAIFLRDGTDFVLEQVIDAPEEMAGAFGGAIALQGDWLVVGGGDVDPAAGKNVTELLERVVLMRRNTLTHLFEIQRQVVSPSGDSTRFGQSVAIAGTQAMIGAPLGAGGNGVVHVANVADTSPTPTQTITPPANAAGHFGAAIAGAPSGAFAIASAAVPSGTQRTVALTSSLAVGSTLWTQRADAEVQIPSNSVARVNVSLNRLRSAVSTASAIMTMIHAQQATLIRNIRSPGQKDTFAGSFDGGIAIADDSIAVGSPNAPNGGVVYTFDHDLNLTGTVEAPSGVSGFGTAVALVPGNSMIVGAPTTAAEAGAVLTRVNLVHVFASGFE
jgi:hypothetical protein